MLISERLKAAAAVLRQAHRDEGGVVAIITALMLTALVGGLAIAIDTAQWRMTTQRLQLTADTMALDAAYGIKAGEASVVVQADANAAASRSGWTGTTTVNVPPQSGPNAGKSTAVEVILSQPAVRFFSGIFTSQAKTLSVRSVGSVGVVQTGSACISSLSRNASPAISIGNNASLVTSGTGCQLVSQSSANPAVVIGTNANVPGGVAAVGTVSVSGNANVGSVQNNIAPSAITDPYASLLNITPSSAGPCLESTQGPTIGVFGNNASRTLSPGRYCNGWNGSNNNNITLLPGVYYVESMADFGNNASITGVGVTIVFGPGISPTISNNASFNITAPTSGPTAGIAITQYSNDTTSGTLTFTNNASLKLTGAVYLPTKGMSFGNNASVRPASTTSPCTQLLTSTLNITNNANLSLGNSCAGVGVAPFGTSSVPWAAGLGTPGGGAVRISE